MRHGLHLSKLSRPTSHRLLMLRNLVSSLLQHQQISTTLPKAKAAQKLADQVIGWGKIGGKDNWEKANGFLLVRTCFLTGPSPGTQLTYHECCESRTRKRPSPLCSQLSLNVTLRDLEVTLESFVRDIE